MNGLALRVVFLFFAVPIATAAAQTPIQCISHGNLQKIAASFPQFQPFVSNKTEYCEAELGAEWLKVANSMVVLTNPQPNEPALDADDALSFAAINEIDWWGYFTARAKTIILPPECPDGVAAYVTPFFGDGSVHLCKLFLQMPLYTQASILMHEVRHFDGHSHTTCTQGFEIGSGGACDDQITSKGSYAVSVQTLVGLARSSGTNPVDKPGLEAEAVYSAFNKFNTVPQVKLKNAIILSNRDSEVYQWDLGSEAKLIKKLDEPAVVVNSNNYLTVYPLNVASDAYRKDSVLGADIANPGLFARSYNLEPAAERAKYKKITYVGTGGMLKGNSVLTLCGPDIVLKETNLDAYGQFTSIISMSADASDQIQDSYLLAQNGDLYSLKCETSPSDVAKIEKTEMKAPVGGPAIVDSFGIDGEQFALLSDGSLSVVSVTNNLLSVREINLPIANTNWVSATGYSRAVVF